MKDGWQWCAIIHADFWALDLTALEQRAYLYLSSFCIKGYPISAVIMAKALHVDRKQLRKAIIGLENRNMITSRKLSGNGISYTISTMHRKAWGQLLPSLDAVAPKGLGEDTPKGWVQLPPLTTNLELLIPTPRDHDADFLLIFREHVGKWQFNRKPIGSHFIFTRGMQSKALEMMRWLFRNKAFNKPELFHSFLNGCGEYLSLDRDVLSPSKDHRATSPGKWLSDWQEQIRLAGIYMEEKAHKITRIEIAEPMVRADG